MLHVFNEVRYGRYETSETVREEEKAKDPWLRPVDGSGSTSEESSLDEHKVEEDQVVGVVRWACPLPVSFVHMALFPITRACTHTRMHTARTHPESSGA